MVKKIIIFILVYIFIYNDSFGNVNRNKVIKYLENFQSLKSNFIQVNNNGDILTGIFYISRPGKFRIEYDQVPILLIGDSRKLAVINKDLKSISFQSLKEMPVGVLLFQKISMKDIKILNLKKENNMLTVDIIDSKFKDQGMVEILFETKPFIMKKWTIIKNNQTKTEVFFDNLFFDKNLSPKLFDIESEDPRKIPWKNN